ncbi:MULTISPECIES: AAA family ATPase [Rhodomicrobium]|uniref:AAA family ATPase n=1 Tax=Rhodomicrobium TaxID=1068 RepID=UPI000B4A9641|nr:MULTISPECIES: AAA family ATPase [Rhodomicrobium]
MLQQILVAKEASYSDAGATLLNLRAVNYVFGTNGSGKTTISRVIANPEQYPACDLNWKDSQRLECLVYNSDFVKKNYALKMPGIFTLGQNAAETLVKIEVAKNNVDELNKDIAQLENTLGLPDCSTGKRHELRSLRAQFEENCWRIKCMHDEYFQEAFLGFRNSKSRFCDKILEESKCNDARFVELEVLKERASSVFAKGLERHPLVVEVEMEVLIELANLPILAKKIVGKEDVDLAELIQRLGNSDWVKQGISYIGHKGDRCPFCQQYISDDLNYKLSQYFDETYNRDIAAIKKIKDDYDFVSRGVLEKLTAISDLGNRHVDGVSLRASIERFAAYIGMNKEKMGRKLQEPSLPISLESVREIAVTIRGIIGAANASILNHNNMVDNIDAEKATLKSEIWGHLLEKNRELLTEFEISKAGLDRAASAIAGKINTKRAELLAARSHLKELEKSITSAQPTVNAINTILASFGFTNFKLATAGERSNLYEIIRADGSNAAETLSEGEKNFITFLYFYHLIEGSNSESGVAANRTVVFDDPISSLDSDILFIVSALIRRIREEVIAGRGNVKQIFILTHNVYFHKEVSYDRKRKGSKCLSHETFWIVRKVSDVSTLIAYEHNPIKTAYELLWAEVRNQNGVSPTIQNTLRRIIENYFKILGNIDKDDIISKFDGADQQICASLFSWVNDGSHAVYDDIYVSCNEQVVASYLSVFRQIFLKTNHAGHYDMMMGLDGVTTPPAGPGMGPDAIASVAA